MRDTLTIPPDLRSEIEQVAESIGESKATVVRLAIRAGLPSVAQGSARPEGYFADAVAAIPDEWIALAEATLEWPQPEPPA